MRGADVGCPPTPALPPQSTQRLLARFGLYLPASSLASIARSTKGSDTILPLAVKPLSRAQVVLRELNRHKPYEEGWTHVCARVFAEPAEDECKRRLPGNADVRLRRFGLTYGVKGVREEEAVAVQAGKGERRGAADVGPRWVTVGAP